MSSNKTEKPTPKKIRDAAKEGQTFKSKDLIATCLMLIGLESLLLTISLDELKYVLRVASESHFTLSAHSYALMCLTLGAKILIPVLMMGIIATVLPGLIQTGAKLALKALKIKFDSLNPVKGIKKIFNIRTVKEFVKALLFLIAFWITATLFWDENKKEIISLIYADANSEFAIWGKLLHSLLMFFLGSIIIIVMLDCIAEFFIHLKGLKMDKKEVRQEDKELNGNPEIKSKRKELHREMLSEEIKSTIKKSNAVIVNPTHIAVCIYINKDVTFIPFISLIETNATALAVKRYAKSVGTPVIEDIALARKIYATHSVNHFIIFECFERVVDILVWLESGVMEGLV
ncbi:EscU/YscU/HrcU family type III secretion system export apparatus switch protein [Pantoea endophytica]